jgi:hypothetical protein
VEKVMKCHHRIVQNANRTEHKGESLRKSGVKQKEIETLN